MRCPDDGRNGDRLAEHRRRGRILIRREGTRNQSARLLSFSQKGVALCHPEHAGDARLRQIERAAIGGQRGGHIVNGERYLAVDEPDGDSIALSLLQLFRQRLGAIELSQAEVRADEQLTSAERLATGEQGLQQRRCVGGTPETQRQPRNIIIQAHHLADQWKQLLQHLTGDLARSSVLAACEIVRGRGCQRDWQAVQCGDQRIARGSTQVRDKCGGCFRERCGQKWPHTTMRRRRQMRLKIEITLDQGAS